MTKTSSHDREIERLNHLIGERLAAARVITTDRKGTPKDEPTKTPSLLGNESSFSNV